jgi:ring-1,2-phenylacetyl-CoA epoxidase subunit PaaE
MSTSTGHFHALRVRDVRPEGEDALVVTFDVPEALAEAFRFQQGQHLTLRRAIDGAEERRSYSICAGRDDGALRVGVRKVPGGRFSGWLHGSLKAGDAVEAMPPEGRFFVPTDAAASRHYLGIAGGSGITPILSILKTVLAAEPGSRFTLVYGNRTLRSTMFAEELEDLKNRYLSRLVLHHVFSRESTDLPLTEGRLDRAKLGLFLSALIDPADVDHAFVCGPHALNDEAEAALLEAGLPPERIHVERFGVPDAAAGAAPPPPDPRDAADATVTIVRDGTRRDVAYHAHHGNVLDAAAAAGLDVPFSCKSGVCCTCRAKLLEGEVRMERNFALEKHEVAAGFVLTCQARPLTERVVLSFDDR